MKVVFSPPLVCACALFASAVLVSADTVILNSGEALTGKILSETGTEIVMDVTVSAGITDQKTVLKSEVQSVSKTTADEEAFQALKGRQLEARSLPAASYSPLMKGLETFLLTYPHSAHTPEVQAALEALKAEKAKVLAGGLKWDNRWYTWQEAEAQKYQLWARILLDNMKEQTARRDFIGALNTFDQIEKNYPGSNAFPDAADLAQSIVRTLSGELDRLQATAKFQETQFASGIALVPEPQKSQMISARQAQIAAAEAAMAASERASVKWKPLLPLASKSFDAVKATLVSEAPRIEKLPVASMRSSIASATAAEEAIKAKNAEGAELKFKEAQALWPQNETLVALKTQITALKTKPKEPAPGPVAKNAEPGSAPSHEKTAEAPAAPTPSPTPKSKSWFGLF